MKLLVSWQFKLFLKVISYPTLVTFSVFIPRLNWEFLFCRGGIGWILLYLSFSWVITVIIIDICKYFKTADKIRHIAAGIIILILYVVLTIPLAMVFNIGMRWLVHLSFNEAITLYYFPFSIL